MNLFNIVARSAAYSVGHVIGSELGDSTRNAIRSAKTSAKTVGKWKCKCGTVNSKKFCTDCGSAPGVGMSCVSCGYKVKDKVPKFCPECGQDFDGIIE